MTNGPTNNPDAPYIWYDSEVTELRSVVHNQRIEIDKLFCDRNALGQFNGLLVEQIETLRKRNATLSYGLAITGGTLGFIIGTAIMRFLGIPSPL